MQIFIMTFSLSSFFTCYLLHTHYISVLASSLLIFIKSGWDPDLFLTIFVIYTLTFLIFKAFCLAQYVLSGSCAKKRQPTNQQHSHHVLITVLKFLFEGHFWAPSVVENAESLKNNNYHSLKNQRSGKRLLLI